MKARGATHTHRPSALGITATWLVGTIAYLVAITNRSSLSALGLDTAQHFSIEPATLSLFAVIQLGVYGAAQIPVGMALDRYGSKAVLTVGAAMMATSALALALAPTVWLAIAARVLLGAGDATVFPCVLRIIGIRFPRRLAPMLVQITAVIGQLGQIISIVPFAQLVHDSGWRSGFLTLAATTAITGVLALAVVSDGHSAPRARPTSRSASDTPAPPGLLLRLRESIAEPGTRLAFWTHFVTPFSANVFGVLWGYPFLVAGEGVAPGTARTVLVATVVVAVVTGPVVGALSARHVSQRVPMVLVISAAQLFAWAIVIALPGPAPTWLLFALAVIVGIGGPASVVAFDFARDHNPVYRLSTATGIVNSGGFIASVGAILLIGITLDATSDQPGVYDLASFRLAMFWQIPLWIFGMAMVVRENRSLRAR